MEEYIISSTLQKAENTKPDILILDTEEWTEGKDSFSFTVENEEEFSEHYVTAAEVNSYSLSGTFCVPDRQDLLEKDHCFSFFIDQDNIVFFDEDGFVSAICANIAKTRNWKDPSRERFLYDFLDQITKDDLRLIERLETELDVMEKSILEERKPDLSKLNEIRSKARRLKIHYDQLYDLTAEFIENENGFFHEEGIRYFTKYLNRVDRLSGVITFISDYAAQIRDLYSQESDVRLNRVMAILTVLSTIFMPLTLITGWYGMNFVYMPELKMPFAYPMVLLTCIIIVISMLIYFKKKKWL